MNYQNGYYENKPKKKKNTILIISTILVIILIILLVVYILLTGDKKNNIKLEERVIVEEKEEEEKPIVIDYKFLSTQLMKTLTSYHYMGSNQIFDQITKYINNDVLYAKDIDNEVVYQVIINKYYNDHPKEISIEEFNDKVKEIFDESFNFAPRDYSNTCVNGLYRYDEISRKYISIRKGGCSNTRYSLTPYDVFNITNDENSLSLEIKILFTDSNREYYYSNIEKTELLIDANKNNYEKYFNQGSTYIFTFLKNGNGNYVFNKSEKK